MPSKTYIHAQLEKLPAAEQVKTLHKALQLQKSNPKQQPFESIAQAMGVPLFPKIESAQRTAPFQLTLRFDDGKEGTVDFRALFDPARPLEAALLDDEGLFNQYELSGDTLIWPQHGRTLKDIDGKPYFHPYDVDPALLYERAVGGLVL